MIGAIDLVGEKVMVERRSSAMRIYVVLIVGVGLLLHGSYSAAEPPTVRLVEGYLETIPADPDAIEAVQEKLEQRVSCTFINSPLGDAVQQLGLTGGGFF